MAEEKNIVQAKAAFNTLCQALENHDWKYSKDEENLSIECGAQGEDLPMNLTVRINSEKQIVLLLSHLPFVIEEEKRLDVAIAVSAANNAIVDGSFDYDISDGHMFFRMTNCFIESQLSEEVFSYMLFCSSHTIDEFNDKFLMISKGMLSIEQFLGTFNN